MDLSSLIILACALAMDSFAVSLSKGFSVEKLHLKHYITTGVLFGGFQAVMPVIGFVLGIGFASFIAKIDHWVAFGLLSFLGVKMLKESFAEKTCDNNHFDLTTMLALAFATSIDALAVGVSFAFLQVNLILAVILIGFITCIFCIFALKIGNSFGLYLQNKAEFAGGVILILLGFKILLEHLFAD